MLSSTEVGAVVTAHDWIRGILWSILASIIGAASKLSIRKSCELYLYDLFLESERGFDDS